MGKAKARESSLEKEGRHSTVGILFLTSLDQLLFVLKMLFTFLQNKLP